ncbi:Retrovirus-related Pol polyprotein [Stylophora pistillata]|uniref:Retrovirus-related Pol polyprotein n=1 Tax=Stylophora pistillata TaxID=50429 RepID=A0A2B4RL02_STYPI|nr:Retrovirus-related Pol polyprotein [Stylophora pistillata]
MWKVHTCSQEITNEPYVSSNYENTGKTVKADLTTNYDAETNTSLKKSRMFVNNGDTDRSNLNKLELRNTPNCTHLAVYLVSSPERTVNGGPGRPKYEINEETLLHFRALRFKWKDIAELLVSRWTWWRRVRELGINKETGFTIIENTDLDDAASGQRLYLAHAYLNKDSEDDRNKIGAVEEKFKAHCAPLTSRHLNCYLFIEPKHQDRETVDEFCSALKTLAENSDLGDKEESWITSMLVLGLKDPFSKERMCRTPDGQKKQVTTLDDCDADSEVMFIGVVNAEDKDWVETAKFGTVQEVFKLDTGAQCNVLPKAAYDKITTNPLQPSSARLESYSKTFIRPVRKCELPCWVRRERYQVCFQVVDGNYNPLLGRSSRENMGLIQRINSIESVSILDEFSEKFYTHSKRVPLKKELDQMENVGIIEKVPLNEPADCVSSLVCVDKLDGSIRVCLDPKDLNVAMKREHYPLPVVDDITTSCSGATPFSTLDAEKAFYQIQLDEESSKLLTLNTPIRRYRYLRMPMGTKSAPVVYKRRVEQVFEGLPGVKVIMDDIIIHGRTGPEHDTRLRAVLQRTKDNNLRLKKSKCHIQQEEVRFHGHLFSHDGFKTDPEKVRAIVEMPRPRDKSGYYDAKKAHGLQVHASSTELGAAFIQEERPLAYASKALTPTLGRYAQIEKELLTVVFGRAKFAEYIVGRDVTVESDHKPLEATMRKPLHVAPLRLQRMLVQLQCFPGINVGQKIVVLNSLRGEMLEKLHDGHLGINKTIARARDVLFWPRMSVEITKKIENCPVCLENRPSQQPEPVKSHEIPPLPSAKFARYGVPSVVVSDNGPCYNSAEFWKFSEDLGFQHITSSPGYPQTNGQSERTVQTVKAMLEKADDPYKALLSHRNTPLKKVDLSPLKMLMGRCLRTSIPVTEDLLKPQLHDPENVLSKLKERQRKQKLQHERKAKVLPPLRDGEIVRVREGNTWKPARITQVLPSPRSYKVETERGDY